MKNRRSDPPWEDLPQELLSAIANLLTSNPIDILTFRSICKSWYSSSPSPSPFNLSHTLPITSPYPGYSLDWRFTDETFGLPIISVTAIFAVRRHQLLGNMEQDTKSWLMFADQLTPSKLMIRRPLTKCYYSMPANFPSCLDVPNIHVEEISRFYNLSFHPSVNKPPSMWSEHVQKVVVNSDETRAAALFHSGQVGASWLRKRPIWDASSMFCVYSCGNGDADDRIDDIVFHEGKVLGVDRVGSVYDVNLCSKHREKLTVFSIAGSGTKRKRLVESNGVLYLVVRESVHQKSEDGARFKVFELDEDFHEWVQPFNFKDYDGGVDDDDMLFADLTFGDLRIGVWHMEDPNHCGKIGSYPGYSKVLWPPLIWLWSVDMSKRIRDLEAAVADLLINAPARKLKAMSKKQPPPLEQAVVVDEDSKKQDIYEIWRAAHRVQFYLNKAKEIHKHLESIKMKNDGSNQQHCESMDFRDQAESSSSGISEWQGSELASDAVFSGEMKLNGILLHLEETTAKLQKVKLLRRSIRLQKPTRDDAFTYG